MWDELSASEKSELMRIFIKGGIRDLGTMRDLYNEYRGGGSIHIKPENRGKFTALKKRTGKSASWFKAHGTPAQRKMATFALNARKWHHGEGGYLGDDDEEYFGGTLPGASVTAYLPDIQSKEGKVIAKNMAERVANGQLNLSNIPRRYYNYVQGEAEGAIPMRSYMDKATNVALGTLAVPLATMGIAETAASSATIPILKEAGKLGAKGLETLGKGTQLSTYFPKSMAAKLIDTGILSGLTASQINSAINDFSNKDYLSGAANTIGAVGLPIAIDAINGFKNAKSIATDINAVGNEIKAIRLQNKNKANQHIADDLQEKANQLLSEISIAKRKASEVFGNVKEVSHQFNHIDGINVGPEFIEYKLPNGEIIQLPSSQYKYGTENTISRLISADSSMPFEPIGQIDLNFNNIALDRNISLNGNIFKSMNAVDDVPLFIGRNANSEKFGEYLNNIRSTIGELGDIGGSSVLFEKGYISGAPHDVEIYTTDANLQQIKDKLGINGGAKINPFTFRGRSPIAGGNGDVDLNIIQSDQNGFASGSLAHSLFRTMHPEVSAKYYSDNVFSGNGYINMPIPKPSGGYYTPEELLAEAKTTGAIEKNVLVDALSTNKPNGGTKLKRPVAILFNQNPDVQQKVSDALDIISRSQLGNSYQNVENMYPNMRFDDVEANEKFLHRIGLFNKKLASDPIAIRNIAEYYNMQRTTSTRMISGAKNNKEIYDFAHTTYAPKGGTGSGGGGNSIMGAQEFPFLLQSDQATIAQYSPGNTNSITNPNDMIDNLMRLETRRNLTNDEISKLTKVYKNEKFKTVEDLHNFMGRQNTPSDAKVVNEELGLPFIRSKDYKTHYVGRYSDKPLAYSYRSVKDIQPGGVISDIKIPYEEGKLIDEYASIGNDIQRSSLHEILKDFDISDVNKTKAVDRLFDDIFNDLMDIGPKGRISDVITMPKYRQAFKDLGLKYDYDSLSEYILKENQFDSVTSKVYDINDSISKTGEKIYNLRDLYQSQIGNESWGFTPMQQIGGRLISSSLIGVSLAGIKFMSDYFKKEKEFSKFVRDDSDITIEYWDKLNEIYELEQNDINIIKANNNLSDKEKREEIRSIFKKYGKDSREISDKYFEIWKKNQ